MHTNIPAVSKSNIGPAVVYYAHINLSYVNMYEMPVNNILFTYHAIFHNLGTSKCTVLYWYR